MKINKKERKQPQPKPLEESASKLRRKIRDMTRSLTRPDLAGPKRVAAERMLIKYKHLFGECVINERERLMLKTYHGVKHIERTKVNRKLTGTRKKIREALDDMTREAAEARLKEFELDKIYIDNFPKTLPYASLYAENDDEHRSGKKSLLREEIRQAYETDTLPDLQKKYRNLWRKRLIKQGTIEDATDLDQETTDSPSASTFTDEFFEAS
ncbi:hypothetical protein DM01DRAFT_1407960 [Hesseltinella vesiculosa]|uniref:rRNA-processing protein EFG1 n=1 Tax=Hesseltinella vesiculosa TaxID=101127 RepID=A0A1X2GGF6_9FUNG|nr:hypothetical protein DM01DRAFT_1407960 [Hesseltinella vesiculosa]